MVDTSQSSDTTLAPSNTAADDDTDYEAKAREMGWRPKGEFKGDDTHFVDAKTFYERGKTVLPIIQAENRALRDELARVSNDAKKALEIAERAREREVAELQVQLDAAKAAREEAVTNSDGKGFTEADKLVKDLEDAVDKSAKPSKTDDPRAGWSPRFSTWYDAPEQAWLRNSEEGFARIGALINTAKYKPLHGTAETLWNTISSDVKREMEILKAAANGGGREDLDRPGPERGGRGSDGVKKGDGSRSFSNLTTEFQKECDRQYKAFYGGSKTVTLEKWRERYVSGIAADAFRK